MAKMNHQKLKARDRFREGEYKARAKERAERKGGEDRGEKPPTVAQLAFCERHGLGTPATFLEADLIIDRTVTMWKANGWKQKGTGRKHMRTRKGSGVAASSGGVRPG